MESKSVGATLKQLCIGDGGAEAGAIFVEALPIQYCGQARLEVSETAVQTPMAGSA
jgi:hypothetical protein